MRDWDDAHLVDARSPDPCRRPSRSATGSSPTSSRPSTASGRARTESIGSAGQHRISSVDREAARQGSKPGPAVHDDLVRRRFTATAPNELWLTDITEHRTDEGKLYLCAIKDACSNRIVGYSIDSPDEGIARRGGLRNAIAFRSPRHRGALRPRKPVPLGQVRAAASQQRASRIDGPGRRLRGQRRDGVVLRAAAEERPGPPSAGSSREELRLAIVDLDRTDLPPPAASARLGKLTPIEFETILRGRSCGLMALNLASQLSRGQSRDH